MKKETYTSIVIVLSVIIIVSVITIVVNRKKIGQKIQAATGVNPFKDYNMTTPTGSVPNNNPLNIRHSSAFTWKGEDPTVANGAFAKFDTIQDGIRAAIINLHTYVTKEGVNTIKGIIAKWAPPTDNNDDTAYETVVMNQLADIYPNLSSTDVIDGNYPQLAIIAWAMSGMEQGFKHQPSKDLFIQTQQMDFPS